MKICLKENEFNPTFIALYGEEKAKEQGYIIVEVDDKYQDCCFEDFENFVFNVEKYNLRKSKQNNQKQIVEIKTKLEKLTEDFIQESIGAVIPDIENKKIEFINLHNKLRTLEGKEARVYIKKV